MNKKLYERLSSSNHNSWAIWDKNFDKEEATKFSFEKHNHLLKPGIIFLGLNISKELEYENFHDPNHTNDHKVKKAIQGERFNDPLLPSLFGSFMTDLVDDQIGANSSNIEINNVHFERFEEKLHALGQKKYHIICFGGKVYDAMKGWLIGERQHKNGLKSCHNYNNKSWELHIYKVMHYAYRFGKNVFPEQLKEIDHQMELIR